HFFVKKDNDEGTEFYYLGEVEPLLQTAIEEQMQNKKGEFLSVVAMEMQFNQPVQHKLYQYLITQD
ncbi:MAG: DUF3427 domain-containing protein, partial [Bacilli bacterium]